MTTYQRVPVRLPHDEDFLRRYRSRHGWDASPEPVIEWVDPDTQVILESRMGDDRDRGHGNYLTYRARCRPVLPASLELCTIEPFYHRRFRASKLWQARWKSDHTVTQWVQVGKPHRKCRKCRRIMAMQQRSYLRTWKRTQRLWSGGRYIGCGKHVVETSKQVPSPDAGKVFAVFSTVKVYGLTRGDQIILQKDGEWIRATVHEYVLWREADRRDRKAKRKSANDHRRYLRQPTWHERVNSDDWI
jgi:hypothetical protein